MENPYAAPSSNLRSRDTFGAGGRVSQRVADIMRRTLPWARTVGICTFIGTAISIFGIVLQSKNAYSAGSAVGGGFIGIIIQLYLGAKMIGYAQRISDLLATGMAADLAAALNEHRKYWKTMGVMGIIFFVFGGIGVVGVVASLSR